MSSNILCRVFCTRVSLSTIALIRRPLVAWTAAWRRGACGPDCGPSWGIGGSTDSPRARAGPLRRAGRCGSRRQGCRSRSCTRTTTRSPRASSASPPLANLRHVRIQIYVGHKKYGRCDVWGVHGREWKRCGVNTPQTAANASLALFGRWSSVLLLRVKSRRGMNLN